MQCGLLGRKLGHSYSPQIHSFLSDYSYTLFEVEPDKLGSFLQYGDYTGLNVTIPYKKDVIPFCNILSDTAQRLGSVNTIVRRDDGALAGHNTDYYGFMSVVERCGLSLDGRKVLVLGSGGASATVSAVLEERNANIVVISRTGEDNYGNIDRHSDASVIVNTTPVGMYPDVDRSPIQLDRFPRLEGVLDLVYNPARTALLQQAEQRGLVTENGLWMLVAQAKQSAEWFLGRTIDSAVIPEIHNKLRSQMENLVLIGMPGSGKSTVGRLLAELLGRTFVDADEEIIKTAGKPIPNIFAEVGEKGFRKLETEVLANYGKKSGLVIATGGGCVTKAENYPHLHQNGTIIWLQRALEKLPVEGRPLSLNGKLETMYAVRKPYYEAFADIVVDNNNSAEDAIQQILSMINEEK